MDEQKSNNKKSDVAEFKTKYSDKKKLIKICWWW